MSAAYSGALAVAASLLLAAAGDARRAGYTVPGPAYPQVTISNGTIAAVVLLPDPQKGYYRGTRFDWSGMVAQVRYKGHTFYGEWRLPHNPVGHDDVTGLSEEFGMEQPVGYAEAKPGQPFAKIGIGLIEREDEPSYGFWKPYKLLKPGAWKVSRGPTWVRFEQSLSGPDGYAYLYRKTVALANTGPQLKITRYLKNTGSKPITTDHYCHNFTNIDGTPVGPAYAITLPFSGEPIQPPQGPIRIDGRTVSMTAELGDNDSAMLMLKGQGATARDNAAEIRNLATGAAVAYNGTLPVFKVNVWAARTAICPEPFVRLSLKPGEAASWSTTYTFSADG